MRNKGVLGSFIIKVCSRLDDVLLSRFVQQNIGEYRLSEKKVTTCLQAPKPLQPGLRLTPVFAESLATGGDFF